MRSTARRIINVVESNILNQGGPQLGRYPIGRFSYGTAAGELSSRGFSTQSTQGLRTVKRCSDGAQQYVGSQWLRGRIRGANTWQATTPKRSNTAPLLGVVFGLSAVGYLGSLTASRVKSVKQSPVEDIVNDSTGAVTINDAEDSNKIRLAEVPKHSRDASSKWVIRGTSVYDITEFITQHPGGELILRACGGSIDPYWKIFSIHEKPEVYDILKQFYIGEIDERDLDSSGKIDWNVLGDDAKNHIVEDPFKHDPERDESLNVLTSKPCNAETPGNLLTDFLTPLKLFFVRNHFWVPLIHESPQEVTIELSDGEEKTYSLTELKEKFKEYTITATLQCSGNRRSHMSQSAIGKTSGLQWDVGAIGTAEFSGVRLRDVLKDAGYCMEGDCPSPRQCEDEDEDQHIHFMSPSDTYAVSIPLQTAINPQADVLLAWDMNGEPINRDHGGPLRAIVPGTTAARSVKWLGRISVSCEESPSQWQQRDYKCFGPNRPQASITAEDWDEAQSIQETPVQSAITNILKPNGHDCTTVKGFAFSGGGRSIVRVDVSADGGKTWKQANLQQDKAKGSRRWAWTLWSIDWSKEEIKVGQETEFVVKAIDDAYNTQPQNFDSTWNFRGLLGNAWHRLSYQVEPAAA